MTESPRDFVAEVDEAVEAYLGAHEAGFASASVAKELIAQWETVDPGLLAGWLLARGPEILTAYISTQSRRRVSRAPRARVHSAFAEFSDEFEAVGADDDARDVAYRRWSRFYWVTVNGVKQRRAFYQMDAAQLAEIRDRFRASAANDAFYARVTEAIRKQVVKAGPDATVESVYTPQELEHMFERN